MGYIEAVIEELAELVHHGAGGAKAQEKSRLLVKEAIYLVTWQKIVVDNGAFRYKAKPWGDL